MWRRAAMLFVGAALPLGAIGGLLRAEPLPKEDCDKLQAEQAGLTEAGVRDQLQRGAEWGRANLSPAQLAAVHRFIMLEEQLSFRCGLAKLRASLPNGEDAGDQELDEKGNAIPAKGKQGQAAAQSKDAAKPAPKTATKKATTSPPTKGGPQPSAAKAKVDDAYRPPASQDKAADPFAGKLPAQK